MLNVTCIVGSSHTNGSCAYLVDALIQFNTISGI